MKHGFLICMLMLIGLAACSNSPAPQNAKPAADIEKTVRAVIAEQLKVNADTIDMKKPLSGPPLKADELDIVELVMTLEERLGVEIPDSAIDKYGGLMPKNGSSRLSPADLVSIAADAVANPTPRKKR